VVGAGGTSYTGANATIQGTFLGASAMLVAITNNSGETVTIQRPEAATDTSATIPIEGLGLSDFTMTSTAQNLASQTAHGIRTAQAEYIYFARQGKGSQRASELVDENSTAHARGITLHLNGSDSDIITQILTREIDDRIDVTSTGMKFTNKNFYITAGDWMLEPKGHIEVNWTLDEAT